ncbi:MAG: rhomboid family intramembrane serine protease [Paracoccaceae bacterium]
MSEPQNQPILNEMPSVVMALFMLAVAIEGFIVLGEQGVLGNGYSLGMRYGLINQYGLFPAALNTQIETGVFSWFELKRYISFTFIHGSSVGTAISCALLLAMGKFVGSVFSNVAMLIVFIGSAIGGAIIYSFLVPNGPVLFGMFTGVYGLLGAHAFLRWVAFRAAGQPSLPAFSLIGFLIGIQVVFAFSFGNNWVWTAELSGAIIGFLICFVVAPGGFQRILKVIRRD